MPTSIREGKAWIGSRLIDELPGTVLDVGAGEGTYANLITFYGMRTQAGLIAIEVHEPYVAEYGLEQLYDKVIVGDARTVPFPPVDVVILGDVIEHMEPEDAQLVWDKARRAARKTVLASIPLGVHPQGAVNGNEHETHRSSWTNDSVHDLGGVVASWTGHVIGCYVAAPLV